MLRLPSLVLALSAALALTSAPAAIAADCPGADLRPATDNIEQVEAATLCLINAERAAQGLPALAEQGQLSKASVAFSQLMVDEHFFAHVSPDGIELTERVRATGYLDQPGSWAIGENIAWGESFLASPANIVDAWMKSPPHRANILSKDFSDIGLGIVTGVPLSSNLGATYTTDFGRRAPLQDDEAAASEDAVADEPSTDTEAAAPKGPAAKAQRAKKRSSSRVAARAGLRAKRAKRTKRAGRRGLSMRAIRATAAG
jgi:uncharacterized protein YkwD